ncbi:large neutral amino acids transporter small subunit 1 isoform X2 [Eurytemora carolleeae]|nr:large neutral amino acids transporter small subunit 1 isoform X2 [Eurytemora carolleeae]XP_023327718.1 large neutral amino acids transporter small subunit 1 isoform X2 [Eurytemora carolleeae]|eukprot:XP_023327717.1 large neutral amino acids transporter small subunit 1-like isoform X2 [Eurytemora affinis]
MTLLNGCTVIIGCIIGSGIFVSPTGVLQSTGSVNMSLVVWTISGIFTMIGAYCYAELGCMIKKSGADYAYIFTALGPFPAFIRLWIECIIVRPCSGAIQALTFSLYILKPFFPECEPPDESKRLLAAACICFLCYINCANVKWANMVQDYFTYAKVFALIIIIITGFVRLGQGHTEHFTWEGTEKDPTVIALSFYSGLFAYTGWNYLNFIIEEMKDPVRDLPRAIAISCVTCLVIYVLTIVAFHSTLSVNEVLGSEAVAVTFAGRLYGSMAWIIPIFVACSTFGAVNGTLLTSSRLFFAGAREGHMPRILAMIQVERATPVPSVLCITILSLLYLTSSNIGVLMNYLGFATWLSIGAAVFCLPYLRWKQPDLPRPIKINLGFPIVYLLMTLVITLLPMLAQPVETGIGLAMILTAVPVYLIFIQWQGKPSWLTSFTILTTDQLQRLLVVMPPGKEE